MRLLSSLLAQTRCNSPCSGIKQQLWQRERIAETCENASQQLPTRRKESVGGVTRRVYLGSRTSASRGSRCSSRALPGSCVSAYRSLIGFEAAVLLLQAQPFGTTRCPSRSPIKVCRRRSPCRSGRSDDPRHRTAPPGHPRVRILAPRRAAHRVDHRRAAAVRPT